MSMDLSTTLFDGCAVGTASNGCLLWDTGWTHEKRDQLITACREGRDVLRIYGEHTPPQTLLNYIDEVGDCSTSEPFTDDQLVGALQSHGWIDTVGDTDYLRRRRK